MNLSRNGKWGIVAVVAVALVAAGAALAATKIHTGGGSANGRFGGPPPGAPGAYGFDRDGDHGGPRGDLSAAATYLGVTTQALVQDLRSGKTLAQVADSTSGKSAGGLVDALVAAAQQRFGGSGPNVSELRARIAAMVNGTGFGDRGHGDPPAPMNTTPPTHI